MPTPFGHLKIRLNLMVLFKDVLLHNVLKKTAEMYILIEKDTFNIEVCCRGLLLWTECISRKREGLVNKSILMVD